MPTGCTELAVIDNNENTPTFKELHVSLRFAIPVKF